MQVVYQRERFANLAMENRFLETTAWRVIEREMSAIVKRSPPRKVWPSRAVSCQSVSAWAESSEE